jgi:antitoxin (DNA-binding transcriptional repressor) of toxin-antitoxin stability system
MTIRVDIKDQADLAELVARMEAGEEVLLTRNGQTVAMVSAPPHEPLRASAPKQPRRLGVWAHLNLDIPAEVFTDPDPELEALMDEPIWPKA